MKTFQSDLDVCTAEDLAGIAGTPSVLDLIRADLARSHGSFTVRRPRGLTGDIVIDEVAIEGQDGTLRFEPLA